MNDSLHVVLETLETVTAPMAVTDAVVFVASLSIPVILGFILYSLHGINTWLGRIEGRLWNPADPPLTDE